MRLTLASEQFGWVQKELGAWKNDVYYRVPMSKFPAVLFLFSLGTDNSNACPKPAFGPLHFPILGATRFAFYFRILWAAETRKEVITAFGYTPF